MTAHEAAVRALAGAFHASDCGCEQELDQHSTRIVDGYRRHSAVALAALTSSEVRAALVANAHEASVGDWPLDSDEGRATRWWVDAILAALAPGDAE